MRTLRGDCGERDSRTQRTLVVFGWDNLVQHFLTSRSQGDWGSRESDSASKW